MQRATRGVMARGVLVGLSAVAGILSVTVPAAAASVDGSGTQASPYMAACDGYTPDWADTCTVTFPDRTVKPLDSERLDFYRCPLDHPYLENRKYSPRDIAKGIEIRGMGTFAIDASVPVMTNPIIGGWVATGNNSGDVTNWNTDPRNYGVTLHCTSDIRKSYGHQ